MKKYGAGDKIPKHRYGIYSKEWPKEREKLVNETKAKLQRAFTKSQWEVMNTRRNSTSIDSLLKPNTRKSVKSLLPSEPVGYKKVTKMILSIHGGISMNQKSAKDISGTVFLPTGHKSDVEQVNELNGNRGHFQNATQGDRLNEKKVYWNSSASFSRNLSPT